MESDPISQNTSTIDIHQNFSTRSIYSAPQSPTSTTSRPKTEQQNPIELETAPEFLERYEIY